MCYNLPIIDHDRDMHSANFGDFISSGNTVQIVVYCPEILKERQVVADVSRRSGIIDLGPL